MAKNKKEHIELEIAKGGPDWFVMKDGEVIAMARRSEFEEEDIIAMVEKRRQREKNDK